MAGQLPQWEQVEVGGKALHSCGIMPLANYTASTVHPRGQTLQIPLLEPGYKFSVVKINSAVNLKRLPYRT